MIAANIAGAFFFNSANGYNYINALNHISDTETEEVHNSTFIVDSLIGEVDVRNFFISQQSDVDSPQVLDSNQEFVLLSVGINLEKKNVLDSLVKGYENGIDAIDLEKWLIPFDDVVEALEFDITPQEDGKVQLQNSGLTIQIDLDNLHTDPDLGLVFSVAEIKDILNTTVTFNHVEYALVFNPPWLNLQKRQRFEETSINTEGLPTIQPSLFTLSTIAQRSSFNGRVESQSNKIDYQGNITAIGSLLGGSWSLQINQDDFADLSTWQIDKLQYVRFTENRDYILGTQPAFRQDGNGSDYWGLTAIQRFGFIKDRKSSGYDPSNRLQSEQLFRTITGKAAPGTLVQLVTGFDDSVVDEVLVDSSGIYRFKNIPTGFASSPNNRYQLFLYPNGQLTAQPIIEAANFSNLPSQLTSGTSALILSAGLSQNSEFNSFFGGFSNFRGDIGYRYGVSENLTLGAGISYDNSVLLSAELFYQHNSFPLQIALSLSGEDADKITHNANISLEFSKNIKLNLSSNYSAQRFNLNWNLFSGVSLGIDGNNQEKIVASRINLYHSFSDLFVFANLKLDTDNQLYWSFNSSFKRFRFAYSGNELSSNATLSYTTFANSLILNHETLNFDDDENYLTSLNWKWVSKRRVNNNLPLLELDLGYGVGSQGKGIIAAASTNVIPGLVVKGLYEEISNASNIPSFRVEFSPTFNVQPRLNLGTSNFGRLQSQGRVLIQPFLDRNGNGILDKDEEIYSQAEDLNLLLFLNNQKIQHFSPDITDDGVLLELYPDTYRLDLDLAGYPLDWQPLESSYAVNVIRGGYTSVQIPFRPSYTVAGTVTDSEDNPIAGVRVEAISTNDEKRALSITNDAGIFFLEGLSRGTYNLTVRGNSVKPNILKIDRNSETFFELNLNI